MKKLLLLFVTFMFLFTLSACTEEAPTLVDFDTVETAVADNEAAVATLTTSLGVLEASLTALMGQSEEADYVIVGLLQDIVEVQNAVNALKGDAAEIVAVNVLVEELQENIEDLMAVDTDLQDQIDLIIDPLPLIIANNESTEIVIAHANDVHGRVNDDSWAGSMGMATVTNLMDALKAQHENVLLIAAGDMLHGTTFATLEEGESMIDVMNQVGFDLMVPGNHDFNYGQDRLLELEALANFPMITANVQYGVGHAEYDAAEGADNNFMAPYVIQEIDGVMVGFFGITTPETTYKTHPDNVTDLVFSDPVAQATAMVAELDPLVDIIILVAHVGLDTNTEITTEDIAIAVPGIDVIIDGHSHSVLPEGMMVGTTLIVSAGEYMSNLGVFTLEIVAGEIVATDVLLIDAAMAAELNYGYNLEVQNFIDEIEDAQDVILGEVVGQTAVELMGERADVRTGETNLGNLIADSMIEVTGADVALTNGGGIRASIPVGDVTLGDIITVLPFGNIIVTIELTGQELLDALEHGTSAYPNAEGHFPHVAGMTFDIVANAAEGTRVQNLMINGVAVVLVDTYLVATNDFLAAGGDAYDWAAKERVGEFKGLHEALTDMFTVGVDVVLPALDRINPIGFTVTEALAVADDVELIVEGIISGLNGSANFVIQDADGTAIVVYSYKFIEDNELELGDKILISGTRDTYYGLAEIVDPMLIDVTSTGNTVKYFAETDFTVADFVTDFTLVDGKPQLAYSGQNIVLAGLEIVDMDYDTKAGYIVLKDASDTSDPANLFMFKASTVPYATTLWEVGDVVDLSVIVYDVYYDTTRVIVYDYPVLSDADAVTYISTVFDLPATTTGNLDYMALDDEFGVALAWSTDVPATITEFGVVSQPAFGEADVDVVVTIVFTKGTETATVTYDVTVTAPAAAFVAVGTELFISEYIEGGSYNKAIEIFNPTGASITLTGYSLDRYSNGSATVSETLDLSAVTIEAGGVYVVYHSSAAAEIISVGDEAHAVINHNGDDAYVLVKDGVIIDVFGVVGEDPGSSWPIGDDSTANHTITRNSDVTGPNPVWDITEWTAFDQDTFDYLGAHVTD